MLAAHFNKKKSRGYATNSGHTIRPSLIRFNSGTDIDPLYLTHLSRRRAVFSESRLRNIQGLAVSMDGLHLPLHHYAHVMMER